MQSRLRRLKLILEGGKKSLAKPDDIENCVTETDSPCDYTLQWEEFSAVYFEIDAIKDMLNISIDTPDVGKLNTKDANNHSALKMPAIELPKFNEDVTQW
ncbi:hypothetical protein PR048_016082 [Dryococelus australis]|uniref:Uncharacterized protein n=1 Tax=Dryococelus australis TaxID=614101 RepID=A0ABQ9HIX3_9NEOP|nr:hypothetical protein PR048_016082 [Dryococelus australis]